MATSKKIIPQVHIIGADEIITLYMDYVLTNDQLPKSVYAFCKINNMDESTFYLHFGSFEGVKQMIWVKLFQNAAATMLLDEVYSSYSAKNKLLTLYYTLFEVFALNRSYILYTFAQNNDRLKSLAELKLFRRNFKSFVDTIIEGDQQPGFAKLDKITKPAFSEGAWIQFLFILKFWLSDSSASFEKTDIVIEKSVNTVVDLLDTKPLENLIDLGKFLWKERMM